MTLAGLGDAGAWHHATVEMLHSHMGICFVVFIDGILQKTWIITSGSSEVCFCPASPGNQETLQTCALAAA